MCFLGRIQYLIPTCLFRTFAHMHAGVRRACAYVHVRKRVHAYARQCAQALATWTQIPATSIHVTVLTTRRSRALQAATSLSVRMVATTTAQASTAIARISADDTTLSAELGTTITMQGDGPIVTAIAVYAPPPGGALISGNQA